MPNWCLLLSDSGIPLLSKAVGTTSSFPFATMGLISALHSAASSASLSLDSASSDVGCVFVREFESIVLAFSTSDVNSSKQACQDRVELLVGALMFFIGGRKLRTEIKFVERAKRCLRVCSEALSLLLVESPALIPVDCPSSSIKNQPNTIFAASVNMHRPCILSHDQFQPIATLLPTCLGGAQSCAIYRDFEILSATPLWSVYST